MHTRYCLADKLVCIVRIARNGGKFNYLRLGEAPEAARAQSGRLEFLARAGDGSLQSAILFAMNRTGVLCVVALAAGFGFSVSMPMLADDSAASIAAGGLVPRREIRIVMAKEVLQISPTKVVVDYDFRNDTDQDVTTEVAFPVPPYAYGPDSPTIPEASFSDFKLAVNGNSVPFQIEAKATLDGKDVTAILTADKIDIPSFGHLTETDGSDPQIHTPDIERLPKAEQQRLAQTGLFDAEDGWGLWDASLQYHWTQTFPAHSTTHIRHQYTPVEGSELMQPDTLQNVSQHKEPSGDAETVKYAREDMQLLEGLCPDPSLLSGMIARIDASGPGYGQYDHPHWVDFILTSANTWKQPIEDFTLTVDRGKPEEDNAQTFVSFCSPQNAPVAKLDADHFQVHLANFVPAAELRIGFFDVPISKSAQAASKK